MPMYDKKCDRCERIVIDVLEPVSAPREACECGGSMLRVWITTAPAAIPDNVPGGIHVGNALCHADGTPRRFDSKSEMHRFAKEHGWTNVVEHKGGKGSDKSKHTQRWI